MDSSPVAESRLRADPEPINLLNVLHTSAASGTLLSTDTTLLELEPEP